MSESASHIADLIERGWSYRQIASVIGMTPGGVYHIRCGRSRKPRPEHAEKIAALHATGLRGPYHPYNHHRERI